MKRILVLLIMILFVFGINSSDTKNTDKASVLKKIADLKVTKYSIKENYSKLISELYLFEDGITGGIAITEVESYKMIQIMVIVVKDKDIFKIESVRMVREEDLAEKERNETKLALSKMDGMILDQVVDAATAATKYTKRIYLKSKVVAGNIITAITGN